MIPEQCKPKPEQVASPEPIGARTARPRVRPQEHPYTRTSRPRSDRFMVWWRLRARWALVIVALLTLAGLFLWRWAPHDAVPPEEVKATDLVARDRQLYRLGQDAPFTGVMVERYPSGALKSRSSVVAGRLHGVSEGWHPSGQIQVREHFVNGVSHGSRTRWYPDGQRQSEATIARGQIDGVFTRWHENGVVAEVVNLRNGVADGLSRSYHPDGSLKAEVRLRKGQVVERKPGNKDNSPVPVPETARAN